MVFYEITKNAVREAMEQPRGLSLDLVNAQQARRALDFLVGFNLSPLLWKKVRPSLSAGRVQSPALRMICEREDEIAAFKPQEYWTIDAELEHSEQKFPGQAGRIPGRQGRAVQLYRRERRARGREHADRGGARPAHRPLGRPQAAAPKSGAAVHDLHAPAGGFPQARIQRAEDHAGRPAALRRRRHRRRRGRPHHLHAHRLAQSGAGGRGADPRGDRQALRPGGARRGSAGLPHQVRERPGSARGDPSDRSAPSCRRISRSGSRPISSACTRSSGSARWPARWRPRSTTRSRSSFWRGPTGRSARCCAPTAPRSSSRATFRCIRRARTTPCRTIRIMSCRPWPRAIR